MLSPDRCVILDRSRGGVGASTRAFVSAREHEAAARGRGGVFVAAIRIAMSPSGGAQTSVWIHISRTATEALQRRVEHIHERALGVAALVARRRAAEDIAIVECRGRFGERGNSSASA